KSSNFSVIDQGYAYLALLLNNTADFILEYNESKDDFLGKKDVGLVSITCDICIYHSLQNTNDKL
ncbi:MAG: hypothetical protein ACOX08_00215, partial [Methanobacterium sp.]